MGASTNPESASTADRHPANLRERLLQAKSASSAGIVAGWILLIGFTLLYGSVSVVYPFGRDQATYAFMGDAILHGMTLYRDVPMPLPPMTALAHALALLLFGRTMAAIRILDLLWTLATAGVLSLFVARVFRRPWVGVVAGLIYSVTYYSIGFWNTAQVDGFLNLPLVVSMYLLARGLTAGSSGPQPSSRRTSVSPGVWFAAGLLMASALLFKYTVGLLLPGAALVLALAPGQSRAERWRSVAWFCGGCLATGLVAVLVLGLSGALPAFIRLHIDMTLPYARLVYRHTDPTIMVLLLVIPALITALALLRAVLRKSNPAPVCGIALVLAWLVAVLASVAVQGKFFIPYHYLPDLPPLAILGAFAMAIVFRPLARHLDSTGRRVGLVAVVLAGLAIGTDYPARLIDLARVASGRLSLRELWSRPEFSSKKVMVSENLALTDYLEEQTRPDDRVASFGIDPSFTFPAWREPVLQFTTKVGIDPAFWELPAEFRANPPDVFTVKHGERLPWVWFGDRDAYEHLMAFAELRELVAARYELEARVGHFDVLRLMNSDSVMPVSEGSLGLLTEDLGEALDWLKARSASGRDSGVESVRSVFWPRRVPDNLDSALRAKMISHKSANRLLWMEEKKLDDLLPALSVWIADDDRPFARQDPLRLQGEGKDYVAGGLSFRVRYRCRNGLVFVYDVRKTPAP